MPTTNPKDSSASAATEEAQPQAHARPLCQFGCLYNNIRREQRPQSANRSNDTETDIALKGIARIANLKSPTEHFPTLLERSRLQHSRRTSQRLSFSALLAAPPASQHSTYSQGPAASAASGAARQPEHSQHRHRARSLVSPCLSVSAQKQKPQLTRARTAEIQ